MDSTHMLMRRNLADGSGTDEAELIDVARVDMIDLTDHTSTALDPAGPPRPLPESIRHAQTYQRTAHGDRRRYRRLTKPTQAPALLPPGEALESPAQD